MRAQGGGTSITIDGATWRGECDSRVHERALKDQMQDVREMLDKRKSSAGGTKPTIAVEDVS